ncbi:NAD(P)-binding protein [Panus rudis PR-1116 ss-1]|nr:NAD(P)-binding protein [Panus rudis PR-1116 ss-1]
MDLPLSGKVAIITGSSRGIGAAIAKRLAADGANVVINYHGNDTPALLTANTINGDDGGRAVLIKADVSKRDGGKYLLEKCIEKLGKPDIVVLNAGVMGHKSLMEVTEEDYDVHFDTNVKGPIFLVQSVLPHLKSGSRIVFTTTTLTRATTILPMSLLFAASKGAVEQFVRVLAKDLGEKGITVNAVAPGAVDTPLFREGKPPQMVNWIAQLHPQKRIPMPHEIAPVVAFLVSDDAGWVNGQTIMVNGVRPFPRLRLFASWSYQLYGISMKLTFCCIAGLCSMIYLSLGPWLMIHEFATGLSWDNKDV